MAYSALRPADSRTQTQSGLSPAELRQFSDNGYVRLEAFCLEPELTQIHRMLKRLFREKIGHSEGKHFDMLGLDTDADAMTQPQIINPSLFMPALLRTEHFRRVRAIARQLLGPHAQFSFDHSILKPARSRAATPWHQDEAHHAQGFFRYRQISFWMPLQDTPAESGCMRYVPESNQGPVLPHHKVNDDPRVHAMECRTEYFDETRAVIEPVGAGACILHDGRTLHAALPNASDQDRLAYVMAFIGPPILRERTTARVAHVLPGGQTANHQRRQRWLLRGGLLTVLVRRLRLGIRSQPAIFAIKARLLIRHLLSSASRRTEMTK
jgi:ectoine hydroxylase-related dioxygenase (phytanoyl-CoA dioxygenase family)